MRNLPAALALGPMLFSAQRCCAQQPPRYPQCMDTAKTQCNLNMCAFGGNQQADAELNLVCAALLAKLASDANAVAKSKIMERAWIAYRDAYVAAMYPWPSKKEYGSIYPMKVSNLRTELTQKQIAALNLLLRATTSKAHEGRPELTDERPSARSALQTDHSRGRHEEGGGLRGCKKLRSRSRWSCVL